jgi:hypothetical protein
MNKFKENDVAIVDGNLLVIVEKVIKENAVNPKKEVIQRRITAYIKAISFGDMKHVNSKMAGIWNDMHLNKCRRMLKFLEKEEAAIKNVIPVYFYEVCYGAEHQKMTVAEDVLIKLKNEQCFEIRRKTYGKENK